MLTRTPTPSTATRLDQVRGTLTRFFETAKPSRVADAELDLTQARDERAKIAAERSATYSSMRSVEESQNRATLAEFDARLAVVDKVIAERRNVLHKLREPFRRAVADEVAPIEAAADAALAEAVEIVEAAAEVHRDIAAFRERNGIADPDFMPRPRRDWRILSEFVTRIRR